MKVQEGDKSRLQTFEGTVLGVRGSGPSATMTVRRETGNFGVERIFPLYNPLITSIEIVKRQKVRRAKLGYLRQAGRRRFKEDVEAMQTHVKAESDKKRLAEVAEKKKIEAEEAKVKAEEKAKANAEAEKAEEEAPRQAQDGKPAEEAPQEDADAKESPEKENTKDEPKKDEKTEE